MKLTNYQFYSLIAVICAMCMGIIVLAFVYADEFGVEPVAVEKEVEKSTGSVGTITILKEESTETENTVLDAPTSSVTASRDTFYQGTTSTDQIEDVECQPSSGEDTSATEAVPTVYEEEYPWYTSDYELLARLVWAEARGESFEGQLAVVEVVFNRVTSESFPDTVYDVIYEPGQFTTASSLEYVTPTQTQYDVVTAALAGERVLNDDKCVFFSVGRSCGSYYTTIGNHVFGVEA